MALILALYETGPEYEAFGDITPDDTAASGDSQACLEERLAALPDEVSTTVLSLAKVVRALEAEAALLEGHGRLILGKASGRRRRIEFLKRWMQLQMEGAGIDKAKDAFVTVWLQASPPVVDVLNEEAVPPEFRRAVLRLPYSLLPQELRAYLQHLDVDRQALLELARLTGEVPDGISIRSGQRHLRLR